MTLAGLDRLLRFLVLESERVDSANDENCKPEGTLLEDGVVEAAVLEKVVEKLTVRGLGGLHHFLYSNS